MKIFKRDLSAIRRQVMEETSNAASQLASLRANRHRALLGTGSIDEVKRIDEEISALEKTITILQDKLRALAEQLKGERNEQRESNRADAIKRIAPQLNEREKIASELEATIKKMSELWFALAEFQTPVHAHWPFPLLPGFGKFDLGDINREMSLALYSAARPIQGQLRMPQAAPLDSGVMGRGAEGLSNVVVRQHAALIGALHSAPLGEEPDSEAA
jgi:hypothetical protein